MWLRCYQGVNSNPEGRYNSQRKTENFTMRRRSVMVHMCLEERKRGRETDRLICLKVVRAVGLSGCLPVSLSPPKMTFEPCSQ